MDPDPVCPERLDPDPDPYPVNIRPDPWSEYSFLSCSNLLEEFVTIRNKLFNYQICEERWSP